MLFVLLCHWLLLTTNPASQPIRLLQEAARTRLTGLIRQYIVFPICIKAKLYIKNVQINIHIHLFLFSGDSFKSTDGYKWVGETTECGVLWMEEKESDGTSEKVRRR